VFDARRPGTGRECTLRWQPGTDSGEGSFVDPCDGTIVPADGGGLPHYDVEVNDDGTLIVDLVMRPTTTTAAPNTTTSTIIITGR
jgi:hypothetical protein